MRKLFSTYTIIFFLAIGSYWLINNWCNKAIAQNIIGTTDVSIQKPGIIKFDWTSGNLDYKGVNVNADAADGDTDWLIYKYTWVGDNPTVIQKKQGSWTGRSLLF